MPIYQHLSSSTPYTRVRTSIFKYFIHFYILVTVKLVDTTIRPLIKEQGLSIRINKYSQMQKKPIYIHVSQTVYWMFAQLLERRRDRRDFCWSSGFW